MSNQFATNSNEATLEDIFCEFGYDFIQAVAEIHFSFYFPFGLKIVGCVCAIGGVIR